MALLVDIKQSDWMTDEQLRDSLLSIYPSGDIRCAQSPGNLDEIEMLAVSLYFDGEALLYPNLKLIQKAGAGVESIIADASIPESVQIARLRSDVPAAEMAEYCLAAVFQEQRHFRQYRDDQMKSMWQPMEPKESYKTTVAILGLGLIGCIIANRFLDNRFQVTGWSRSPKQLEGVQCYSGMDQLPELLAEADYVISILPSTPETVDLFDQQRFSEMKPSAVLINVGRGDLVNESDLVKALDDGQLSHAILDVVQVEPLPNSSPMWRHAGITITPHVSGWHLGDSIYDIAKNFEQLEKGQPLLHLVDRQLGY
ncbi:MAG: glyoxylate/hydroxypyruvate reductase A [Gammaproteobacteria bacterium]|jgi:glyoxylate/hydroxypyruvate reductase A